MDTKLLYTSYDCEVAGGLFRFVPFVQLEPDFDEKNIEEEELNKIFLRLSEMYTEPRSHPYLLFCTYFIEGNKCKVLTFQPLSHSVEINTIAQATRFMLQNTIYEGVDFNIEVNFNCTDFVNSHEIIKVKKSHVELLRETEEIDIYEIDNKHYGFMKNVDLKTMTIENVLALYNAYQKNVQVEDIDNYVYFDSQAQRVLTMHKDQIVRLPDTSTYSLICHRYKELSSLYTFTNQCIKIQKENFILGASLISSSQFYMSETDPFQKGFILK
ncbi:hypothetical protein [Staphylococcus kloosii]|jgi:hypothetical protein|uniref:hypothetical protein n=1 Tax=Staphylococcus kloosii TaxID=29384 RepID=UPI00189D7C96|nr:hypothetical protein [Staphylococcus kloosii]MBF7030252.1 hypothetical protein [Staphylococcus kloosii]